MKQKKTISYILVTLLFVVLVWKIIEGFDQIKNIQWKLEYTNLIPLMLVLLPAPFVNALSWHLMTKFLGGNIRFEDNFKIWTYSNAARFFPGSVWQYAGRVYMLSQKGISKSFTTTALLLEAGLNVAAGSIIALLTINLSIVDPQKFFLNSHVSPPLVIVLTLLAVVAIATLAKSKLAQLKSSIKTALDKGRSRLVNANLLLLPLICLSVLTQFILAGLALFFTASIVNATGATQLNPANIFPFIGIYSASWVIGYLAFLAPSGLGVREASITGLLTTYVPLAIAGFIAILFRISSLISEALTVFIVFAMSQKKPLE